MGIWVNNKLGTWITRYNLEFNGILKGEDLLMYIKSLSNKQNLECIGEKRTLLNNILRRTAHWIGLILRRNCLLHDAIERQMTELKGIGRRRIRLLDDLRNKRIYWELKEEAEDRKTWKQQYTNLT